MMSALRRALPISALYYTLLAAFRDDRRCAAKYGKYWQSYCSAVPWKVIPYIV